MQQRVRRNGSVRSTINMTVEVFLYGGDATFTRGDIVTVYRTSKVPNVERDAEHDTWHTVGGVPMAKTGYVHVPRVPDDLFQNMLRLTRTKYYPPTDGRDPHSGGIQYKRRWRLVISELSDPVRDELLANKEITRSWVQFKNRVKNKITGEYLADSHLAETDPDPDR